MAHTLQLILRYNYCVGNLQPTIITPSLMATSVTVSWTQPPFSFTPVGYTVTLARVNWKWPSTLWWS